MVSAVDSTIPANNVKASKADFRAQFLVIKDEITALQARSSVAGMQAFQFDIPHPPPVSARARDMAFGRTSLTSL